MRRFSDAVALAALTIVGWLWVVGWAHGQANNSNTWQTPGNQTVGGAVQLCPNTSGLAVPCTAAAAGAAGLPVGATALGGTGTGTTAAVTATITPSAGTYAYVCGISIEASATTATSGAASIATLVGSGTVFVSETVGATATPAGTTLTFPQCVRASAISTAITLTTVAAGTGGATTAYIWGYQQ